MRDPLGVWCALLTVSRTAEHLSCVIMTAVGSQVAQLERLELQSEATRAVGKGSGEAAEGRLLQREYRCGLCDGCVWTVQDLQRGCCPLRA